MKRASTGVREGKHREGRKSRRESDKWKTRRKTRLQDVKSWESWFCTIDIVQKRHKGLNRQKECRVEKRSETEGQMTWDKARKTSVTAWQDNAQKQQRRLSSGSEAQNLRLQGSGTTERGNWEELNKRRGEVRKWAKALCEPTRELSTTECHARHGRVWSEVEWERRRNTAGKEW